MIGNESRRSPSKQKAPKSILQTRNNSVTVTTVSLTKQVVMSKVQDGPARFSKGFKDKPSNLGRRHQSIDDALQNKKDSSPTVSQEPYVSSEMRQRLKKKTSIQKKQYEQIVGLNNKIQERMHKLPKIPTTRSHYAVYETSFTKRSSLATSLSPI